MPLHPVPIIIGTTLAIVSSGYAFKKFVYDPHLAPLIEAWLAAHHHSLPSPPIHHHAVVPVPSVATSTARRDHHTRLRRRSTRQAGGAYELLPHNADAQFHRDEDVLAGDVRAEDEAEDVWGRASAYDLKGSVVLDGPSTSRPVSPLPNTPLVDLESPQLPPADHADELRSVMFDCAPTVGPSNPAPSNPFIPPSQNSTDINPSLPVGPVTLTPHDLDHSTTLSFLSLASPQSSQERWAMSDGASREDDMISLPDTSTDGYEDAETYSPFSGMSPARVHATLSPNSAGGGLVNELGLSCAIPPATLRRGPLSVVSMSESEGEGEELGDGWRSESEWGV